jgi:hypothetical protein
LKETLIGGSVFRFSKPDGSPFTLDYTGVIHAYDSGNDLIAICRGMEEIDLGNDEDDLDTVEVCGSPCDADDWEIVIKMRQGRARALQHALSIAYNALALCERMS